MCTSAAKISVFCTPTTCLNVRQNLSQKARQPNSGCAISECTLLTQQARLQARMCKNRNPRCRQNYSVGHREIGCDEVRRVRGYYVDTRTESKSLQNVENVTRPRFISSLSIKLSGEFLRLLVYVCNGALQYRRRRCQTHSSKCGSAKGPDSLRNGASADQQPQTP